MPVGPLQPLMASRGSGLGAHWCGFWALKLEPCSRNSMGPLLGELVRARQINITRCISIPLSVSWNQLVAKEANVGL
jgi:hypothetical protein